MQNFRNYLVKAHKLAVVLACSDYRRALFKHGVAASVEHDDVIRTLPFDLLVDIGANRGQFSLASLHWRPEARVIAFEPLDRPAKIYRKLFAAWPRVVLHQIALGPERGELTMHISKRDDSSSLLPIAALQTENFPGTEHVADRMVSVLPLSDIVTASDLGRPALLKIDVQGYELPVLKSAEPILQLFDWVFAECSFKPLYEGQALAFEIEAFLTQRGFRRVSVNNISYARNGSALQGDFLFANLARGR